MKKFLVAIATMCAMTAFAVPVTVKNDFVQVAGGVGSEGTGTNSVRNGSRGYGGTRSV